MRKRVAPVIAPVIVGTVIAAVVSCSSDNTTSGGPGGPDASSSSSGNNASSSGGVDARAGDDDDAAPTDGATDSGLQAPIATLDVGGTYAGWVKSIFNKHVYVAVQTGATTGNVTVFDAPTRTKLGTVDVGGAPTNIAIHDQTTPILYVTTGGCADASGQIVTVDSGTMKVTKTTASAKGFDVGLRYYGAPGGDRLYANPCGANKVQEYDGTGTATARNFATTGQVVGMDSDFGGQLYWFGNNVTQATLIKIATLSNTSTTTTYSGTAMGVASVVDNPNQAAIVTENPNSAQLVDPLTLALPPTMNPQGTYYRVVPADGGSKAEICIYGCFLTSLQTVCYDATSGEELSSSSIQGFCDQKKAFIDVQEDGLWVEQNGQIFVFK
jgi:hypothetical protein